MDAVRALPVRGVGGVVGGRGRDGVEEGEVVHALDEVDDVAGGAAAEAVEPVRDPVDGHRRGGVVVERAAADPAVASRLQLHTGRCDDVLDRVAGPATGPGRRRGRRVTAAPRYGPAASRRPRSRASSVMGCGSITRLGEPPRVEMSTSSVAAQVLARSTAARSASSVRTAYSSQVGSYA